MDRREFLAAVAAATPLRRTGHGTPNQSETGRVSLQVTGQAGTGYGVAVLLNDRPVARHTGGGEFSAAFQNSERSLEDRVDNWKATSWTGDARHLTLRGECAVPSMQGTVSAEVEYKVLTSKLIRKTIRFHQADLFMLFYQVSNSLEPVSSEIKFWSFDDPDCQGGSLREYYPSAGFRTREDVTVGLLTDSGYRNLWSRMIRRDGQPVKPAAARVPDLNLYSISGSQERAEGRLYVRQTFGESTVEAFGDRSYQTIQLPEVSRWTKREGAVIEESTGVTVIS
ncbi:MAG: hypothetical protein WB992_21895, partial [Bryobacteraceae bacterium]